MNVLVTAAMLVGLVPALAMADGATTQPARLPADKEVEHPRRQDWLERPAGPERPARAGEWSEAEWEAAGKFFRIHSPRRWQMFEQLKMESARKAVVQRFLLAKYRALAWLEADKDLYDNKVRQVEVEDVIFGLSSDLRQTPPSSDTTQARQQLHDRLAELVDLRMKEREFRIERAERLLQLEKERLTRDKQNRAALVKEWSERVLKGDVDWLRPDRPRKGAHEAGPEDNMPEGKP